MMVNFDKDVNEEDVEEALSELKHMSEECRCVGMSRTKKDVAVGHDNGDDDKDAYDDDDGD
eukprot:scaffold184306_cov28-Tisochrysis_lutea.AAC.1